MATAGVFQRVRAWADVSAAAENWSVEIDEAMNTLVLRPAGVIGHPGLQLADVPRCFWMIRAAAGWMSDQIRTKTKKLRA